MTTATEERPTETPEVLSKPKAKKAVADIKRYEGEADSHMEEADNFRAQAAGLIVQLLDAGATERQVADAIGKGRSHVHFAATAWRLLQGDEAVVKDFNSAYKLAKRPAAERTPEAVNTDTAAAENPFPSWAKQMRELKRLTAEMIDQASLAQVRQFLKTMEKQSRAAATKEQDMAGLEG
jgi:hypothetical protein